MKQLNQRDAMHYIETRQEFRASALEGRAYGVSNGRLNETETARYNQDLNAVMYWVYSYSTPIAWYTKEGWYCVAQKFSMTTSKHQGIVRRAIANTLVGAE
jgi:bisphosphoglycerate-dependent phosphoglycerate mutase